MPAYERTKEVEAMIAKVMKKKEINERDAITYMLGVAAGRLKALWRYDDKLPEGKSNLGILTVVGRKKRAEKSKAISTRVVDAESPAPKPRRKAAKRKTKAKPAESTAAVAAE